MPIYSASCGASNNKDQRGRHWRRAGAAARRRLAKAYSLRRQRQPAQRCAMQHKADVPRQIGKDGCRRKAGPPGWACETRLLCRIAL